jgi:hypothetical protein
VLYPQRFTPLVRAVLAAAVVVSWAGFVRRSRAGQASQAGQAVTEHPQAGVGVAAGHPLGVPGDPARDVPAAPNAS